MPWYVWVGAIAAIFTLVGSLAAGARVFWRIMVALVRIADAMPTLLDIAQQFKPNGGKSLHDRLGKLELGLRALLMDRGYPDLDEWEVEHRGQAGGSSEGDTEGQDPERVQQVLSELSEEDASDLRELLADATIATPRSARR